MSWVRTDDALHEHPKIMALGDRAFRVWSKVLHYASRFPKQAGFVSDEMLRRHGATDRIREDLLRAPAGFAFGLWETAPGGIVIHDFADYVRRREDVSEKRAEAGRKSGEKRRERAGHPTESKISQEKSANDPQPIRETSANDPQTIREASARPPRPIDDWSKSSESLKSREHFVQQAPRAHARDPVPSRPVSSPSEPSGATATPLLTHPEPRAQRAKRQAKYTPDEIANRDKIVAYFKERVACLKGIDPETVNVSRAAYSETFTLVALGFEEARSIIERALGDPFVRDRNCSLEFIASRRNAYRGAPARSNGVHPAIARADEESARNPARQRATESPLPLRRGVT